MTEHETGEFIHSVAKIAEEYVPEGAKTQETFMAAYGENADWLAEIVCLRYVDTIDPPGSGKRIEDLPFPDIATVPVEFRRDTMLTLLDQTNFSEGPFDSDIQTDIGIVGVLTAGLIHFDHPLVADIADTDKRKIFETALRVDNFRNYRKLALHEVVPIEPGSKAEFNYYQNYAARGLDRGTKTKADYKQDVTKVDSLLQRVNTRFTPPQPGMRK